ncbi:MAG: hypothetical protein OEM23_05560 [Gemmatimonadota bacterium]|nr:hypothetical protein [Gemmatimonadota bacterium]MDH3427884.1 hypothetical protein [Gemmatimonadota bacterium]
MTYEDRLQYQEGREKLAELRANLDSGDSDGVITRAEALVILDLLDAFVERVSPERWDRALEAIVHETSLRVERHN